MFCNAVLYVTVKGTAIQRNPDTCFQWRTEWAVLGGFTPPKFRSLAKFRDPWKINP
jgi:hypothetical protein